MLHIQYILRSDPNTSKDNAYLDPRIETLPPRPFEILLRLKDDLVQFPSF